MIYIIIIILCINTLLISLLIKIYNLLCSFNYSEYVNNNIYNTLSIIQSNYQLNYKTDVILILNFNILEFNL